MLQTVFTSGKWAIFLRDVVNWPLCTLSQSQPSGGLIVFESFQYAYIRFVDYVPVIKVLGALSGHPVGDN